MPSMIPDTHITNIWTNAHTASGVDPASSLLIQNKGMFPILIFISATAPAPGSTNGVRVRPNDTPWICGTNEPGVWIRCEESGQVPVCIQENV